MDYPIDSIPGFKTRKIVIRPAGLISSAQLLIDGQALKGRWGEYIVQRDDGLEVQARLRSNFIDPVPQLVIAGQKYAPAKPLTWYQLAWASWPMILILFGGAFGAAPGIGMIGAFLGILATYINGRVFRSEKEPIVKYALAALVGLASVVAYMAILVFFVVLR